MVGTRAGGIKAAKKNKSLYGDDFYKNMGKKGGKNGHTGGFACMEVGEDGLTGRERARVVGAIGGKKGKRTGVKNGEGKRKRSAITDE